ncbi:M16 family metallopeptidase [Bernardetia sp.]|uniref:M16 family metallopeptidase n=1 Tax=Bernardetia sp. TaxID=1937974 RepID=UPI0025C3C138|nr:pitrilysin family protein [Bernardetia sp.]
MNKIILSSFTLLFLVFGSFIPNNKNHIKDKPTIEFTEFTLKNGLHVILHEDHSVPLVAVSVLYHVGSKNEEPNRTGFAHFFEHLLFEGSKNIKRGEFDDYIENAGGANNANTTYDRTFYYEIMPSNQLELALWLESERMLHARVDSAGIETQRQVVKEERRQRIDNRPYGSILEETMKRVYTKHPYKSSVIGSMEHLDAAEEKDYKNFYEKYYVPNNAVVSIAGDIDVETAKELVAKYFASIPKGKKVIQPNVLEPLQTGEVRDTVYDNIQLPAVVQAFKVPARGNEDYYATKMLFTLLSEGESSRLSKSVKDEQQKAVFVGAFPLDLEQNPSVALAFGIASMGVEPLELEAAMNQEYENVKEELIGERELQKLKNQFEANFYTQNSTIAGIAETLADNHVYGGDANLINTEIEKYMEVTREDIQTVAKKYLVKENRVTLYYLPKK